MRSETTIHHPERLLRARAVYERLGVGRSTFYALVRSGEFPAPVRISEQAVGWLESNVNAWIQNRPQVDRANG
ncbi:helix-turn-helix transcriptional regulator [Hyphomicrobium sp. 2TAF46]|uniref:helix-turn-helix transcriptional regulator n=1 Tax=Hyphomicrobium sp. 2TAF46 TaxID=3233019 RepID=UPI003F8F012A